MNQKNPDLSEFVVRRAEIHDIPALVQLRMAFLSEGHPAISPQKQEKITVQLPMYIDDHLNKDLFVALAESGGRLISTAFLVVDERPANLTMLNGRLGTVLNVFTDPSFRGHGIATKVMAALLSIAMEQCLSRVDLMASEAGMPLYQKFGFEISLSDHTSMSLILE